MSQSYLAKHVHHMIPRFLGGTDDPSNLVTLTIKEHIKAHWVAFHLWEHPNDLRAARVLAGLQDDSVSCIWCKKSYSQWNFYQHIHGGKCKHPAQPKGRYTHVVSCVECKKSFTRANFKQHKCMKRGAKHAPHPKYFSCLICKKSFTKSIFIRFLRVVHKCWK